MANFFTNMLTWWQWTILAVIPPLIVMLYFLKLRRQPLQVPSTYLWARTIEDLHVNSIWQRLRQNLLLFLQLLLVALVMLACLRPGWQGTELTGNRFIFLIDSSASMSATDVKNTRLGSAKLRALEMVEQMKSGDVAMVISFSNVAKVEQPFTDNRRQLRDRIGQIMPTNRTSDLAEALRAASGLANPGQSGDPNNPLDTRFAEAMPATLYILSDGGFAEVPKFSLGNLEPKYLKIGTDQPANVGIVAFSVGRNPDKPAQQQAFGRLENFGPAAQSLEVSLYRDGSLIDAKQVDLPAAEFKLDGATEITNVLPGIGGVQFDLPATEEGQLKLEIGTADALLIDNIAYAAINTPRRARVLFVTNGSEDVLLALSTEEAQKLAEVSTAKPSILETKAFLDQAATGQYDLMIFDQCAPKVMPQCNTLFLGSLPPLKEWSAGKVHKVPSIIDTDRAHPLMQLVELGNVLIFEAKSIKGPQGSTVLIDADAGPIFTVAPREGFEDAVLGFSFTAINQEGRAEYNTDWYRRLSFPVFFKNVLEYLGGNAGAPTLPSIQPGTPMILRPQSPVKTVTIETPSQQKVEVAREGQGNFVFTSTNEPGVYNVQEGTAQAVSQRFAVNLFSSRESDLKPAEKITLGYDLVAGTTGVERARKELWKWLLLLGLGVLIFEWYVYNRRVYF
ncbi:MAG TPA: BatA and WFA domain-containing protein [Pirellulaceae bacterium]|nr:BatA and WFA domain-containing protein [Pirellulaceae bacterium]